MCQNIWKTGKFISYLLTTFKKANLFPITKLQHRKIVYIMRVKDAFFFSFFFGKEIQDLPFYLSGIQDRNLSGTENSAF